MNITKYLVFYVSKVVRISLGNPTSTSISNAINRKLSLLSSAFIIVSSKGWFLCIMIMLTNALHKRYNNSKLSSCLSMQKVNSYWKRVQIAENISILASNYSIVGTSCPSVFSIESVEPANRHSIWNAKDLQTILRAIIVGLVCFEV